MTDAPLEGIVDTLAGMPQDGLIRHIGSPTTVPSNSAMRELH
jgi:hypothetical protein